MTLMFSNFVSRDLETKKDCITQSLLSKCKNGFPAIYLIVKYATFSDVWNSDPTVISELTTERISRDVTRALKE